MADRYFVSTPITGDAATLTGPEAHHLRDVMRAARGSRVLLFDGSGCEFDAEVLETKRGAVELRICERREVDRELPWPLTLGVALPKGERQRWLVEKAVELGVTRLVPVATQRSVAEATPGALERLKRSVIEAAKQCGRNRLMEIAQPVTLAEYLRQAPPEALRLLASPDGSPLAQLAASARAAFLAIGPEGGFTAAEVELAQGAGWSLVGLGPRVLRVETAGLLLAGMVAQSWLTSQ